LGDCPLILCPGRDAGHEVVFATGPDAVQYPEATGLAAVTAGLPFAEISGRYFGSYPPETLRDLSPDQRLEHIAHCEVVVCHAGAGTVLGALAHGLPLVMMPVASGQH
jgi:UDP:flavonoid glycosyltransferase YjiC (YdhE family)